MSVKRPAVAILLSCLFASAPVHAGLLQTLGPRTPGDADGRYVVGGYNGFAFVYDDVTRVVTTLPISGAAHGISGDVLVGSWGNIGWTYNLSTTQYTTLNNTLGVNGTRPNGIDGDNVVGSYVDAAGKQHGFLYDISDQTWTKLDYPGAFSTTLADISGNYIVGEYSSSASGPVHALVYDRVASTWSTIGGPGYEAFGIDGNNVVGGSIGWAFGPGWVYNLDTSEFTDPLVGVSPPPGQLVTGYRILGISHNTIVGQYHYRDRGFSFDSGFVYIGIPEVGTFGLTGIGMVGLALLLCRRTGRQF